MIPKNIENRHVIKAIEEITQRGVPYERASVRYDLTYEGNSFPPKYVVSLANKYANQRELKPSEFNAGPETNDFLTSLGFSIADRGMSNYWLNVFSAATWRNFRNAGARTIGFPESYRKVVKRVPPGDILLCYVMEMSRWVGALAVIGPSNDHRRIWSSEAYPVRVEVKPLILLDSEDGVPLEVLEGRVSFFEGPSDRPAYKGFFERWPRRFELRADGDTILGLLENEFMRPKKYWVEKTLVKGRADRISGDYALGKALWSPQKRSDGHDIYAAMREVHPEDVILHLTDNKGFSGVSVAASSADTSFVGLQGTEWAGRDAYLIRLKDYVPLETPLLREEFLDDPDVFEQLARILEAHKGKGLFYNREHDLNQGAYLTEAPSELISVLNKVYHSKTGDDLPHVDIAPPPKAFSKQQRYTRADFLKETGFDEVFLDKLLRLLDLKPQIIIQGPPGTGKTYVAERLAKLMVSETTGFLQTIQFHQTYAYEDFIQGIHPRIEGGALSYKIKSGRFLEFCAKASQCTPDPCVLIIDEINRANLSRVFGELMYLLEYRENEVPLAYEGTLKIPKNVFIIGTMNTADRSIALVDYALRRRFSFVFFKPDYTVLERYLEGAGLDASLTRTLIHVLTAINKQINDQNYEVGISFFLRRNLKKKLRDVWEGEIEPYLEEFFYDSPQKVAPFRWAQLTSKEADETNLRPWVS